MAGMPLAGLRTPLRAHGRSAAAHAPPLIARGLTLDPSRRRGPLLKQAWQWRVCGTSVESVDAVVKSLEERAGETGLRATREELKKEIELMVNAGKEQGKDVVVKEFLAGEFVEICSTEFKNATMDGKSTLGQMSFNNWEPKEEETLIEGGVNIRGDAGGSREYRTDIFFKLTNSGIQGRNAVAGSYEFDEEDPSKILVQFSELRVSPKSSDPSDVEAWKAQLGPHNPTMGDDGSIVVSFDKAPHAYLKFVYMDKDLQCFETQAGTFRMLKRKA
ncbi:unnamed protein product [Ostreobium quekettii]|uniref:Plastid lipid-associated protein/fibrillin conserved domain-containing protein n=1 Tax=Ostreobium quekettii TaxID=121088 RepID=A0A8S1JCV8_9CHLO|nr:unnamed protein product [Ostreobium quekettii]|eukprot:evm.model.scf_476.10 EVM.evm.TU.scf_476.10   scf_476:68840-72101(-)